MLAAVNDAELVAEPVDAFAARLGGNLLPGLHEVYASSGDAAAAIGFAVMLAVRHSSSAPVVWVTERRSVRETRLYGWGLAELGLDPERLLLVEAPDPVAMLRAAREALTCSAVGTVVMQSAGKIAALDLTATRRLHLAAVSAGVLGLSVRTAAEAEPSAAMTRWRVETAPSRPLPGMAPGRPRLSLHLERHRGGVPAFQMTVDWDHRQGRFRLPNKIQRQVMSLAPIKGRSGFSGLEREETRAVA